MTANTGIKGKTVPQLSRVIRAQEQAVARSGRTAAQQLARLDERPGVAWRERARLNLLVKAEEPPTPSRTRRRARRPVSHNVSD